jgi:hypothetical protein
MSFLLTFIVAVGISSVEIQTAGYLSDGFCMRPECVIHVVVDLMAACWRQSFAAVRAIARNDRWPKDRQEKDQVARMALAARTSLAARARMRATYFRPC